MQSTLTRSRLCLNMIVRNEARIITRCLRSVAEHIDCWVICDTGSTDGTPELIEAFFRERNIPGEIQHIPFVNFEQARNQALDCALAANLAYDYLLLTDADMELVAEPGFPPGLEAAGYTVQQKARISYWNVRLVRRDSDARYRGVTHEYLSVPGGTKRLAGIRYIDHAEGSSRKEKFTRDVALLEQDLQDHPNRERSWFYLAQTFRDMARWEEAAAAYRRRTELGGWAEEAWFAQLQLARCLLKQGDENGFLREALIAWNQRPHRAEPLYDLARFHRDRSLHHPAILFAQAGMQIPRPEKDSLFIEDWVYEWALREEYSIVGFYVEAHRAPAAVICNELALNPDIGGSARKQARRNLKFYAQPLAKMLKSFQPKRVEFEPPNEWHALNPSIVRCGDDLYMVQRTVNYVLTAAGYYITNDGGPVRTRNFFLQLDANLAIKAAAEILPPIGFPEAVYGRVLGFEDMRLFVWKNEIWASSTLREQNENGRCQIALSRLQEPQDGTVRLTDYRVVLADGRPLQNEKNWMAMAGEEIRFIYSISPTRILDATGKMLSDQPSPWASEHLRGGSQAVAFGSGWLALSHEHIENKRARHYLHRFVWFDAQGVLQRVSPAFSMVRPGVEFVAGLAWHPDGKRLIISFGVADAESWLGICDSTEIATLLAKPPESGQARQARQ